MNPPLSGVVEGQQADRRRRVLDVAQVVVGVVVRVVLRVHDLGGADRERRLQRAGVDLVVGGARRHRQREGRGRVAVGVARDGDREVVVARSVRDGDVADRRARVVEGEDRAPSIGASSIASMTMPRSSIGPAQMLPSPPGSQTRPSPHGASSVAGRAGIAEFTDRFLARTRGANARALRSNMVSMKTRAIAWSDHSSTTRTQIPTPSARKQLLFEQSHERLEFRLRSWHDFGVAGSLTASFALTAALLGSPAEQPARDFRARGLDARAVEASVRSRVGNTLEDWVIDVRSLGNRRYELTLRVPTYDVLQRYQQGNICRIHPAVRAIYDCGHYRTAQLAVSNTRQYILRSLRDTKPVTHTCWAVWSTNALVRNHIQALGLRPCAVYGYRTRALYSIQPDRGVLTITNHCCAILMHEIKVYIASQGQNAWYILLGSHSVLLYAPTTLV